MSWKYGVWGKHVGSTKESPSFNAVAFATAKEADEAGKELLYRWFVPDGYVVVESTEPVNYRFNFDTGQSEYIKEEKADDPTSL